MKKKWLCLFFLAILLMAPFTGAPRLVRERLLARALTATGGACAYDTMVALGSVAVNRAGPGLSSLQRALDAAGFARGQKVSERALKAARSLLDGTEESLDFARFSRVPGEEGAVRVGTFYFMER